MVLNEFFAALTSGRFLLAIVCCVIAGLIIGQQTRSIGGKIAWSFPIAFVVVGLLVTSIHVRSLVRASETGALPSGFFDNFVILTVAICLVLYLGSMMWSTHSASVRWEEEKAIVEALGPNEIVRELNIIGAHPALAHGWFGDRWKTLSDSERQKWAEQNITALHELRLIGGEHGFAGLDLQLPVYLASIDHNGRN